MAYYFGKNAMFTPEYFGEGGKEPAFQIETPIGPEGKEKYRCARCENGRAVIFVHNAPCNQIGAVPEGQDPCAGGETEIERKVCQTDEDCIAIHGPNWYCDGGRCKERTVKPPPGDWILICAGGTCQERKSSLFDLNDRDVVKRIQSCQNKSVGDRCTPFIEPETVLACKGGTCREVPVANATTDEIANCRTLEVNKRCGPLGRVLDCVDGTCVMVNSADAKNTQACIGKNTGDKCGYIPEETELDCVGEWCVEVPKGTARKPKPCMGANVGDRCGTTPNYDLDCVNGTCKEVPKGTAKNYDSCVGLRSGESCGEEPGPDPDPEPEGCEGGYKNTAGGSCSYGFESKGIGGEQWCCPKEAVEPMGEYKLPGNLQELLDALIARGKELLGKEVGFSEAQKTQMLDALPEEAIESLAARRRELLAMRPGYEPELEAALSSLATSLTGRREEIAGIEPGYTPGTIAEMVGALPKELHGKLMGRAGEVLDMPFGFTPGSMARAFGRDFETIRAGERGGRESLLKMLGTQGKLGTGAVPEQMGKLAWGTEQNISNLVRDLYLQNEMQKREDLYGYTGLAQGIFGQGMSYADLVKGTYGEIEEKKKRDVLDYTSAMLNIAPMEMAALTAPSERRKADVLDYTGAAAAIVPQEMAYARQLQDLLTSFKGMEKADILDFTGMAQGIFGTGAGAEQLVEMINAARRGEGSQALAQLLALLGLLKY